MPRLERFRNLLGGLILRFSTFELSLPDRRLSRNNSPKSSAVPVLFKVGGMQTFQLLSRLFSKECEVETTLDSEDMMCQKLASR
jgi:hypothetical protein